MGNMESYLDWRGDITFDVDPFNIVDAVILCQLIYTDFEGFVPAMGSDGSVSVQEVCERYFNAYTDEDIKSRKIYTRMSPFLMRKLVVSKRFAGLRLSNYVNEVDLDSDIQLSAVTYHLGDGTLFIAYRGTDSTMAGWKEDLMLSYQVGTNGQLASAIYLNYIRKMFPDVSTLRVGGHSKGGNFAVYAACCCNEDASSRIRKVYCLDGPGFSKEFVEGPEYTGILPKVESISPEVSLVGCLFESRFKTTYVKSSEKFLLQHDMFSWQVLANHMVTTEKRAPISYKIEYMVDEWLVTLDEDTRASVIDTAFDILSEAESDTFPELTDDLFSNVGKIFSAAMNLPKDKQRESLSAIGKMLRAGGSAMFSKNEDIIPDNQTKA